MPTRSFNQPRIMGTTTCRIFVAHELRGAVSLLPRYNAVLRRYYDGYPRGFSGEEGVTTSPIQKDGRWDIDLSQMRQEARPRRNMADEGIR